MKNISEYILESNYDSSNLEDLKKQLLKMNKGDRIHALWGVREKWTDATRKDRMVDYALSIDKETNKKYVCCGVIDFKSHDLFKDACKAAGVSTFWSTLSGFAIRLDYEDMVKVLEVMPKFFNDKKYVNGEHGIWHFLSFDREECEKECEKQVRPFTITSLEDEIKGIEKGIKELETKKAQLQELKQAQTNDENWKEENIK